MTENQENAVKMLNALMYLVMKSDKNCEEPIIRLILNEHKNVLRKARNICACCGK